MKLLSTRHVPTTLYRVPIDPDVTADPVHLPIELSVCDGQEDKATLILMLSAYNTHCFRIHLHLFYAHQEVVYGALIQQTV